MSDNTIRLYVMTFNPIFSLIACFKVPVTEKILIDFGVIITTYLSHRDISMPVTKGKQHLPLPCDQSPSEGDQRSETGLPVHWQGDNRGWKNRGTGTEEDDHGEEAS